MAATKVETCPPPTFRGSFADGFHMPSSTSGSALQLINSLRESHLGGTLTLQCASKPKQNHVIYKASAPASSELCPSEGNKTGCKECEAKPNSVFGAFSVTIHHPLPWKADCTLNLGSSESLIMPALSRFVSDCFSQSKKAYCTTAVSQNSKQICKHCHHEPACFDVTETTAGNAPLGVSSDTLIHHGTHIIVNKEACGRDDEILGNDGEIHAQCNDIHALCNYIHDDGSYSDSDDCDFRPNPGCCCKLDTEALHDHHQHHLKQEPCHIPIPKTEPIPEHHGAVTEKVVLKKLLSDESGYCENFDFPSKWSLWQNDSLALDSDDVTEWDEDDEDTDADESADSLWRSFEDSIFSPQLLKTPPKKDLVTPQANSPKAPPTKIQCHTRHPSKQKDRTVGCDASMCYCGNGTKQNTYVKLHNDLSLLNGYVCTLASNARTVTCSRKQVHFPDDSELSEVHEIVAWNFAYRAARRGHWEQFARDRAHFRRRIDKLASLLEPCLARKMAADMCVHY